MINGKFQNINFFKNPRLIWKQQGKPQSTPSAEQPEGEELSLWEMLAESQRISEFLEHAEERCAIATQEGGEVIEQSICTLGENKQYQELRILRHFINDLWEEILLKSLKPIKLSSSVDRIEYEHYRKTTDTFERLQILKQMMHFDEIMKYLKKAVSYEFQPEPAAIIFTYPDSTKEEYAIEPADEFSKVFKEIERQHRQRKKEKQTSEMAKPKEAGLQEKTEFFDENQKFEFVNKDGSPAETMELKDLSDDFIETNYNDFQKDFIRELKEEDKGRIEQMEKISDPDEAHEALLNNTSTLSEDLLQELSEPISRFAEATSHSGFQCTENGCRSYTDEAYQTKGNQAMQDIKEIVANYYGTSTPDLSDEEQEDFMRILNDVLEMDV